MNKFNKMTNKEITIDEVSNVIKKLKLNKSPSSDEIYNEILKLDNKDMHEYLALIFNICLKQGIFPTSLKESIVVAIYKKKSPHTCNNYWPVKLLSVIGKLYEHVIANRIQPHLETNFLSESQAGFMLKFSTEEQIIYVVEEIRKKLIDGQKHGNIS